MKLDYMVSLRPEQKQIGGCGCGIPLRRPALAANEGSMLLGDTIRAVLGC